MRPTLVLLVTMSCAVTTAEAQGLFERLRDRTREAVDEIQERANEVVRGEEADALARRADSDGGAFSAGESSADFDESQVLDYPNLLRLYIARHRDLLSTDAFAWHYFQVYKAPQSRTPACTELQQLARNPIRFEELVARESEAFSAELSRFESAPTEGVFSAPATVWIGRYDSDKEAFPIEQVSLSYNSALEVEYSCEVVNSPPGADYAPRAFTTEVVTEWAVTDLPMSREAAIDLVDRARMFVGPREHLPAIAEVRVRPLPFIADRAAVTVEVEVLGLQVDDPSSGEPLYTFTGDYFPLSAEDAADGGAAEDDLLPLTAPTLMLALLRDNPDVISTELARAFATQQVQAEQQYWQTLDGQVTSSRLQLQGGSAPRNINAAKLLFTYEWQSLRQSEPVLADQLLEVFVRPNATWAFYRDEPGYDSRLEAYVGASVFSREAIGLPSVDALLAADVSASDFAGPGARANLPAADLLGADLAGVMVEFLRQVSWHVPDRLKLDFDMLGRYDAATGRLLIGGPFSTMAMDAPAAQPLTPLDNATFAAGGEDVGRSLRPPLPMSAQGRVLYQVPHMNTPTPSLPGLYRSSTPIAAWFASLSASSGGGPTNIGSIGALALDREVAFPAIEVSRDVVERARAGTRSPSPDFPVIARVLLDVERVDVVKLLANYGGRDGQPLNRGALIARVAGLQVLSATGELIASLD